MRGCMENFMISFKPYLDICQSQKERQSQHIGVLGYPKFMLTAYKIRQRTIHVYGNKPF